MKMGGYLGELTKEGRRAISPLLAVEGEKSKTHRDYVERIVELSRHFEEQTQEVWRKSLDHWDLYLAVQKDLRDPIDEQWRSDVFVPMPFITTRAKASQAVELLGNTEPVWQVEAVREQGGWYEQSRHFERLLDHVHRMNAWRKFLYKLSVARSVQGTAFFKVVWKRIRHVVSLFHSEAEQMMFESAIHKAVSLGAPQPPDSMLDPAAFDMWRHDVNLVERYGFIPSPPVDGPREVIEYEGPIFQMIPLWQMRIDPMIDEMRDQQVIVHRMVKPLSYVLARADDDPNSPMPYLRRNVLAAQGGLTGEMLATEEQHLAETLGLNPSRESHPYFREPVELLEVHSPEEPLKFSIIMNRQWVINKRASENPLLTSTPNIFMVRNIVVPGFAYGISDYQEPETLFRELNQFRRLRMDGASLSTLPVFMKQAGMRLTEAMRKLRPGMVIDVPGSAKDAIQSLIKHTLPPEAYREPAEIKQEIEDATEVYGSVKGAPATVGRVTGTEYQGRASQVLLKYKIDASILEDELLMLPSVIISMYAQMAEPRVRLEVGGDPDAIVDVSREQLVQALNLRFRFRGATKHLQPELQIQQLTTAIQGFPQALSVQEQREALKLVLQLLDIRGWTKILSDAGQQQMATAQATALDAANATNQAGADQARLSSIPIPGSIPGGEAGTITGQPPPPTPAPVQ